MVRACALPNVSTTQIYTHVLAEDVAADAVPDVENREQAQREDPRAQVAQLQAQLAGAMAQLTEEANGRGTGRGPSGFTLGADEQGNGTGRPLPMAAELETTDELRAPHEGGLRRGADCASDVPLANTEAICVAFERYCF